MFSPHPSPFLQYGQLITDKLFPVWAVPLIQTQIRVFLQFFLCMINFSHLRLCWKDSDNLNPLKSLARNDGRLNSQGKFMQQIPRCALCELHNQKPRYRGDSYHGHNWQRPKIELRFHHRSF